ncbi:MAG TPA: LysM peptidoglycan-binding domain-containing protein [Chthoniobacteraceae bacterium]|nr:LysM peptidoglycan-binding domain-containing protein [Chthoniobacteraceae bacterium]
MKLQIPKMLTQRPAFLRRKSAPAKPPVKLNAATASQRMKPGVDDNYDDEPQTRLSSAFFVVLILHVVAVGGIYAFNSIKAHRHNLEPATAAVKPAAADKTAEPAAAPPAKPRATAPDASAVATATTAAPAPTAAVPVSSGKVYHVKSGDTLTKIAAALNVTVAELQFVNAPKELAVLHAGQVINVPVKKTSERPAVAEAPAQNPPAKKTADAVTKPFPAPTTYEVQKGDTATSIAKRFSVSVDDLLTLNKVIDPKKLQLGQMLKLPVKKN